MEYGQGSRTTNMRACCINVEGMFGVVSVYQHVRGNLFVYAVASTVLVLTNTCFSARQIYAVTTVIFSSYYYFLKVPVFIINNK